MDRLVVALAVIGIAAASLSSQAAAGPAARSENLRGQLIECAKISDGNERLRCLDTVVGQLSEEKGAEAFGLSSKEEQLSGDALDSAGVERGNDGRIDAISAAVRSWSYNARGQVTIVLDDGQTWQQTGSEQIVLKRDRRTAPGARIVRGALGSFNMALDGANRTFKVRRLSALAR